MNCGKSLRIGRIAVGSVCFAVLTASCTGLLTLFPRFAALLEKVQFFPAATAFSIGITAFWLLVTLVFGRIYCSTVCPLGVWQDVMARFHRKNYHFSRETKPWRIVWLAITVAAITLGISVLTGILDPFGLFSKFCAYAVAIASHPAGLMGAAALAGAIVCTVCMGVVSYLAVRSGRTFCNTVCPVGTTLGFVSRHSIFHIDINTDLCINCRKCEYACKSSCIDLESHTVDSSRCVDCFDCLPVCPNDAIHYTWDRHRLSRPLMQPVSGSAVTAMRKQGKLIGSVKISATKTESKK